MYKFTPPLEETTIGAERLMMLRAVHPARAKAASSSATKTGATARLFLMPRTTMRQTSAAYMSP